VLLQHSQRKEGTEASTGIGSFQPNVQRKKTIKRSSTKRKHGPKKARDAFETSNKSAAKKTKGEALSLKSNSGMGRNRLERAGIATVRAASKETLHAGCLTITL